MASSSSASHLQDNSIPIEDILLRSGLTGRWQFLIVTLATIPVIATDIIIMAPTFYKINVPYTCASSLDSNVSSNYQDQCASECDDWIFDYTNLDVSSSIQESYNLVCDREILIKLHGSICFLGLAIGSVMSGYMSDRIGRVKWMRVASSISTVCCVIMATTDSYLVHLICWTFINIAVITTWIFQSVIYSEVLPTNKRHYPASALSVAFGVGIASSAPVNIAFPNWRHAVLFHALCTFISTLLVFYCQESPRWLWSSGRYEEAFEIIRWAAQFGGNVIPADVEASLMNLSNAGLRRQSFCQTVLRDLRRVLNIEKPRVEIMLDDENNKHPNEIKTSSHSIVELFKNWTLCTRLLILAFLWIVANTINYGVLFGGSLFKQQLHIYAVSQGAANIVGGLLILIGLTFMGRKTMVISCLGISGSIFVICILKSQLIDGLNSVVLLFMFCVRIVIQTCVLLCYTWSAEMMPTVVRSSALGFCSLMSRIFGLAIPYVELLAKLWADLPLVFFSLISFLVMVCATLLPETQGMKLPDTIEEGSVFGINKKNLLLVWKNSTKCESEEN